MSVNVASERGVTFLKSAFEGLNQSADLNLEVTDEVIRVVVNGDAANLYRKADLVSALHHLVRKIVSRQGDPRDFVIDFGGHQGRRAKILNEVAPILAEKAQKHQRRIIISNLNSVERKGLHRALKETSTVETRSEGRTHRELLIEPV